jgi:hypothetical protein
MQESLLKADTKPAYKSMPETLIKVDLTKSAYENDMIHNRWHPDIPIVAWVNPGDDFIIETYDWTGGFIKNNDSADDVRDIDLSIVHFLSGPIGVKGAEPGDLLVVDLLDVGPLKESLWGFNGFFSRKNGGGFLTDHFPLAQKSIWDIKGLYTSSRHVPGVNFAGLIHPGLIGCLPDPKLLAKWNERETALIATNPTRVPGLANPPFAPTAHAGRAKGDVKAKIGGPKPLTGCAALMAPTINDVDKYLADNAKAPDAVRNGWLEGQQKVATAETRSRLFKKAQAVFTIIVGQVWFTEFPTLDDKTLTLPLASRGLGTADVACTVELEEEKIEL